MGGFDGCRHVADVDRFDPRYGKWESAVPLPAPRAFCSAISVSGSLLVLGGSDGKEGSSSFVKHPSVK